MVFRITNDYELVAPPAGDGCTVNSRTFSKTTVHRSRTSTIVHHRTFSEYWCKTMYQIKLLSSFLVSCNLKSSLVGWRTYFIERIKLRFWNQKTYVLIFSLFTQKKLSYGCRSCVYQNNKLKACVCTPLWSRLRSTLLQLMAELLRIRIFKWFHRYCGLGSSLPLNAIAIHHRGLHRNGVSAQDGEIQ